MANYRLSNTAKEDLIRIHQFTLNQFGEVQADKYIAAFFHHFEIIASKPNAFEAVDSIRKGYRRCICGSDSIFYRIQINTVEIMAIVGRKDLDQLFRFKITH